MIIDIRNISPELVSFIFLLSSVLMIFDVGGVFDNNLIMEIIVNGSFLVSILMMVYVVVMELFKSEKPSFDDNQKNTMFFFAILNIIPFIILIIMYRFYSYSNIFIQILPYYLLILSIYLLVFVSSSVLYYVDLFRNKNSSLIKTKILFLKITQFSLLMMCLLNVFYYSNPYSLDSGAGYGSVFILLIIIFATIFSWLYFLRNSNSVFYYLFWHPGEPIIKQHSLTRDEFLNKLITKNSILYSLVVNSLAIILFINLLLLLVQ